MKPVSSPLKPQEVLDKNIEENEISSIIDCVNNILKVRAKKGYCDVWFYEIHKECSNYILNKYEVRIKKLFEDAGWVVERFSNEDDGPNWSFSVSKIKR